MAGTQARDPNEHTFASRSSALCKQAVASLTSAGNEKAGTRSRILSPLRHWNRNTVSSFHSRSATLGGPLIDSCVRHGDKPKLLLCALTNCQNGNIAQITCSSLSMGTNLSYPRKVLAGGDRSCTALFPYAYAQVQSSDGQSLFATAMACSCTARRSV